MRASGLVERTSVTSSPFKFPYIEMLRERRFLHKNSGFRKIAAFAILFQVRPRLAIAFVPCFLACYRRAPQMGCGSGGSFTPRAVNVETSTQ